MSLRTRMGMLPRPLMVMATPPTKGRALRGGRSFATNRALTECESRGRAAAIGAELPMLEIPITSWVRHGPPIVAASGPTIIQAVLWAGTLLAS